MIRFLLIFILGAGLLACSSVNTLSVNTESVAVSSEYQKESKIDSIVSPYRDSLEDEMLKVIAKANNDFTKGRPNGSLNNWSADAVLRQHTMNKRFSVPVICLLNVGGLRNPLSKGDVTVGDIFKLMPFDNEVVFVEMPINIIPEIEKYLVHTGGEPIAGAQIKKGEFIFNSGSNSSETFWILTSDYLMNGGDKMNFFEKRISYEGTGVLLRDTFLEAAELQGELIFDDSNRISFE